MCLYLPALLQNKFEVECVCEELNFRTEEAFWLGGETFSRNQVQLPSIKHLKTILVSTWHFTNSCINKSILLKMVDASDTGSFDMPVHR